MNHPSGRAQRFRYSSWMRWLLALAVCGLSGACGDEPVGTSRYSASAIEAPEHFDVQLCAELVRDGAEDERADRACQACCRAGDFTHFSHVLADRCVCARLPERPTSSTVCAEAEDDAARCGRCCVEEGFASGTASGDGCACEGVSDPESCSGLSDEADPELSCQVCCVEHGYLSLTVNRTGDNVRCICRG